MTIVNLANAFSPQQRRSRAPDPKNNPKKRAKLRTGVGDLRANVSVNSATNSKLQPKRKQHFLTTSGRRASVDRAATTKLDFRN